ncbi:hypothetical protein J3E68DRAFT_301274 [Trichoderma sp. SZMC 28012]
MLFDDSCVLCYAVSVPSCLAAKSDQTHSNDQRSKQGPSNQINPVRQIPDPDPGWKFPRQTLKARERGLFLLMAVCLVLGCLISSVLHAAPTVQYKCRGDARGGSRGSLYLGCKRAIHIRDIFPWSCHDDTLLTTGTLACAGSHR